jgi:raffinose/stachyose/melibiose transport system permease protein
MASTTASQTVVSAAATTVPRKRMKSAYPLWFYVPAAVLFLVLFVLPTFTSFYFSLTRWTLFNTQFIGLDNFVQFFTEETLYSSFIHTLIYAFITCFAKVVIGIGLAVLLTSNLIGRGYLRSVIFFPVLVSAIGVGFTFQILLDPFHGPVNGALSRIGITGPGWLTNPDLALFSVAGIDIWKGVGIATLIFIAGIVAIPSEYYEAARVDGASGRQIFWSVTLPLLRPATATVILLALIGGLRSFDIIWATTGGGPGFSSDVIGSVIYKQYQAGFYGLSTAGNVVLFVVVTAIVVPLNWWLTRREVSQ